MPYHLGGSDAITGEVLIHEGSYEECPDCYATGKHWEWNPHGSEGLRLVR